MGVWCLMLRQMVCDSLGSAQKQSASGSYPGQLESKGRICIPNESKPVPAFSWELSLGVLLCCSCICLQGLFGVFVVGSILGTWEWKGFCLLGV